jgi:lysozyme
MKISNKGKAELMAYECICLTKYLDSGGVQTIGAGATVSDIPDLAKWPWSKTITVEEAVKMFEKHVQKYSDAVDGELKVKIPQHQFDALVSICYNIGTGNLKTNKGGMAGSTFMKRVNAGESNERVCEAMAWFNKDNGKVVKGLVNRRAKERSLYIDSNYSSGGICPVAPVSVISHKPLYGQAYKVNVLELLEKSKLPEE